MSSIKFFCPILYRSRETDFEFFFDKTMFFYFNTDSMLFWKEAEQKAVDLHGWKPMKSIEKHFKLNTAIKSSATIHWTDQQSLSDDYAVFALYECDEEFAQYIKKLFTCTHFTTAETTMGTWMNFEKIEQDLSLNCFLFGRENEVSIYRDFNNYLYGFFPKQNNVYHRILNTIFHYSLYELSIRCEEAEEEFYIKINGRSNYRAISILYERIKNEHHNVDYINSMLQATNTYFDRQHSDRVEADLMTELISGLPTAYQNQQSLNDLLFESTLENSSLRQLRDSIVELVAEKLSIEFDKEKIKKILETF